MPFVSMCAPPKALRNQEQDVTKQKHTKTFAGHFPDFKSLFSSIFYT